ncbi:hypothetical protein HWV62_19804 [Athelia sp. TMB]|nr:hypothetical protein HWV62_19804 [Athelia sp. TMB]
MSPVWYSRKGSAVVLIALLVLLSLSYSATRDGGYHYMGPWRTRPSSSFREMLSTVLPSDRAPHSKTLGVSGKIYVIGLPGRADRRSEMEKLQDAMDITFTWHNATDMHSPAIGTILERIRHARAAARGGHEGEHPNPEAYPFAWPADAHSREPLQRDDIAGSELWFLPQHAAGRLPPLKPVPVPDTRPVEHVAQGNNEPNPDWPLKLVEISCWHSHFEVLRKIADGDDDVALIFEDDIDMEFDLDRRLRSVWPFLPADGWDMVMLGHCQSNEASQPAVKGTSYLYPSTMTMCTHGYAVSKKGAAALVRMLRTPLFAYSRPIDHAYTHLKWNGMLNQFSMYPAVVVQSKTTMSDIGDGTGPDEDFFLMDSALARVHAWENQNDRAV